MSPTAVTGGDTLRGASRRVLVAIAARSQSGAGEEVTLTRYRSLVILASRGRHRFAAPADRGPVAATLRRLAGTAG